MIGGNLGAAVQMLKVMNQQGGASQSWESYWASRNWANYFYKIGNVIYANKETSIVYHNPTYNYGAHITCFTGGHNTGADEKSRILMDFDLTPLDDKIINSVSLNLYLVNNLADNARKIQVFRMKRAWTEGTGTTGTPLTGDGATWNTYDGSNNWTSAGAFDPSDCEQTPIGELELSATERGGYKSIPLSVTSKDELTLGYGFLIKMETEENDAHVFYTKEYTAIADRYSYISCSYSGLQNGTVSPLLTKDTVNNPLFEGTFGSIVYEGVGQYSYYYCRVANRYVYKRSSTDGLTWGTESKVIDAGLGNYVEVASAWKEGSVWYMLYRSNEWGGSKAIGLATSTDGTTWTKEATNPVITHTDIGAWCTGDIDPWGIIKVGSTYYLWVNDVNEIPRQSGLMTSTDLINWTPDVNNPIFDNGRYCGTPIKYDGNYYMFMPYTPLDNIRGANPAAYRIELYRDSDPRFLATSREYLGNVMLGGEDGEWDDDYLDTPSILTETIQRDTFPLGDAENGKLWMYYTGHSGTVWAQGLAIGHLEMLPKLTALTEPGAGE